MRERSRISGRRKSEVHRKNKGNCTYTSAQGNHYHGSTDPLTLWIEPKYTATAESAEAPPRSSLSGSGSPLSLPTAFAKQQSSGGTLHSVANMGTSCLSDVTSLSPKYRNLGSATMVALPLLPNPVGSVISGARLSWMVTQNLIFPIVRASIFDDCHGSSIALIWVCLIIVQIIGQFICQR